MSHEEDDDAFLYGDDNDDSITVKRQKLETDGKETQDVNPDGSGDGESKESNNSGEEEEDDDEEDGDSESDSDSDIEFIIGSEQNKADATAQDAAVSSAPPIGASEATNEVNDIEMATEESGKKTDATITRIPDIDINKVGDYEGKPITAINLQDLKEKPWRQPGADVSEYFNYGFDEFTWTAYCAKQDNIRANFNPQKLMMSMMPMGLPLMGFPAPPGGLPPFPQPNVGLPLPPTLPGVLQPGTQESSQTSTPEVQNSFLQNQTQPPSTSGSISNKSADSYNQLPKAPARERDYKDRNEYDRERNNGYNNDYRDRDRRPRYRGRR